MKRSTKFTVLGLAQVARERHDLGIVLVLSPRWLSWLPGLGQVCRATVSGRYPWVSGWGLAVGNDLPISLTRGWVVCDSLRCSTCSLERAQRANTGGRSVPQ